GAATFVHATAAGGQRPDRAMLAADDVRAGGFPEAHQRLAAVADGREKRIGVARCERIDAASGNFSEFAHAMPEAKAVMLAPIVDDGQHLAGRGGVTAVYAAPMQTARELQGRG